MSRANFLSLPSLRHTLHVHLVALGINPLPCDPTCDCCATAVEESKAILLRQKIARSAAPSAGSAITLSTLESILSSTIAGAATTVLTNPM